MLTFTTGDILADPSVALVNTVNCVGVMGRGIALQFRKAFPDNYRAYVAKCKRGDVAIGRVEVFETGRLTGPQFVINFPTKKHWRGKSRIEWIEAGLDDLVRQVNHRGISSVAIPPLGCGLGGLEWSDVKPLIASAAASMPITDVTVYEPAGAPAAEAQPSMGERPAMTPGRAALVALMHRYLEGGLDPFVSLLEVHKLMYFMQMTGEPLRLRYVQASHGPYAENLRHVLTRIEGHFVRGYADGGDRPEKMLTLLDGAMAEAASVVASHDTTAANLARVSELVTAFESPSGLELLASIHWLASTGDCSEREFLLERLNAWSDKGTRFNARQFDAAYDQLASSGWIGQGRGTVSAAGDQRGQA